MRMGDRSRLVLVLGFLASGCPASGDPAVDGGGTSDTGPRDAPLSPPTDAGPRDAPPDAGPPPDIIDLPFDPSNVGSRAHGHPFTHTGGCTRGSLSFDSDLARIVCMRPFGGSDMLDVPGSVEVIPQTGGAPELVVFYVDRLELSVHANVTLDGDRPTAIVAQYDIVLDGSLEASSSGFPAAVAPPGSNGHGPGGGGFLSARDSGGEGGAFCSVGGLGTDMTVGRGVVYGTASLIPLIGGSSGGMPFYLTGAGYSGSGGGAIQLVAGGRIEIPRAGSLIATGERPSSETSRPGGGGSGGAILLEAPVVVVNGTVRATGTAGSTGADGGLPADNTNPAQPGTSALGRDGGGGGGLGRIRINSSTSPTIAIDALMVPNVATGCASFGPLAPATAPPVETNDCPATPATPTVCESCLDDACCDEITACAASPLCMTCITSATPGPACASDPTVVARRTCRTAACASACGS